jgi:prefoldin subunit 5
VTLLQDIIQTDLESLEQQLEAAETKKGEVRQSKVTLEAAIAQLSVERGTVDAEREMLMKKQTLQSKFSTKVCVGTLNLNMCFCFQLWAS